MIELESREVSFHRHFSPGPSNQNLAGSLSCNTYNKKFHQSGKLKSGEIHTHTRYKTLYNKSSLKNTVFWNHVSFWGGSMFIELPYQWIIFLQTCHKVMNCLTSLSTKWYPLEQEKFWLFMNDPHTSFESLLLGPYQPPPQVHVLDL